MWTIRRARPDEQGRLFAIWHDAVRATHGFLEEADFAFYARLVRDEMLPAGDFWVPRTGTAARSASCRSRPARSRRCSSIRPSTAAAPAAR